MHFFCIFLQKKTLGGTTPFFANSRAPPRHTFWRREFRRDQFLLRRLSAQKNKIKNKKKIFFIFYLCLKIFFIKNIFSIINDWWCNDFFRRGIHRRWSTLDNFPRGLYKATFGARRKVRDLSIIFIILSIQSFFISILFPRSVDGKCPPL